jgi:hypothetical protein
MALLKVILPHQRGDRFLFAGDLYEADAALLPELLRPDDQFLAPLFELLAHDAPAPQKAAEPKPPAAAAEPEPAEAAAAPAEEAEPAARPKKKQ